MTNQSTLPENDPWSTPFAKTLLGQLELFAGASVLDIASGGGIPAFYIAEKVGPEGQVLALDIHPHQVLRGNSAKGGRFPWLQFEQADMRNLPPHLPEFDRITGNLSFMFFRPDRPTALRNIIRHLKPGGQIVLTFPSYGTFDSIWQKVEKEMRFRGYTKQLDLFHEYLEERPSGEQAQAWLNELGMERVHVVEEPLEIQSGPGREFLHHPLLRGGFLDDVYECFEDQMLAEEFMTAIANDLESFKPIIALRCAMSGWKPIP